MGLKVSIRAQDSTGKVVGSEVVICDGPDPLPTYNIRLNGKPIVEVVPMFEADYVTVFDRFGRRTNFSFEVKRRKDAEGNEFSGPASALAYAMDHCGSKDDLPHFGLVTIEMSDENDTFIRFLNGAAIEQIDLGKVNGVSLGFAYNIVGGQLLKTLSSKSTAG